MSRSQVLAGCAVVILVVGTVAFAAWKTGMLHGLRREVQDANVKTSTVAITTPAVASTSLPIEKELEDGYYVSQTRNNCGPSALSMDLSFYGVHVSQETIADDLRPTHSETGEDDKSTIPEQLVAEAQKYGFTAYYRPDGNIQELKEFVANGIPVITRTLFMSNEDFGHYRVIKGYDDATGQIIDEDGFSGPEVKFSYAQFLSFWQEYNYEYIVLVPPGKEALVQSIIGNDMNTQTAWANAKTRAESEIPTETGAPLVRSEFNLSVDDYYLGDYQESVDEFQKVQSLIPIHTMWYQMEPIESYYELGDYSQVISLAQSILSGGDPVYPNLLVLEGQTYEKEGNTAQAKADFQLALQYNKNDTSAQQALAALQ